MEKTGIVGIKDIWGTILISRMMRIDLMTCGPLVGTPATKEGVEMVVLKGSCMSSLLSPSSPCEV